MKYLGSYKFCRCYGRSLGFGAPRILIFLMGFGRCAGELVERLQAGSVQVFELLEEGLDTVVAGGPEGGQAEGLGAGSCHQADVAGAASFSAARVYPRRSRCQVCEAGQTWRRQEACGQVDSRSAPDHFPTGQATTEAVNSLGT